MVRYNKRISIIDAYIIDEIKEKESTKHDYDGTAIPLNPAYEILPGANENFPDEIQQYQDRVIIIEL